MPKFFAVSGLLGGLFWLSIRFFPPECAQITEASEVLCNRLWSPALWGMLLGFSGLFLTIRPSLTWRTQGIFIALPVGGALMFGGNFLEYWMLTDLPHQGPNGFARSLAWMTVLFGLLLVLVASAPAGWVGFKLGCLPRWLCVLLMLLFPTTLAIGLVKIDFVGLPMGLVSVGVGLAGLSPAMGIHLNVLPETVLADCQKAFIMRPVRHAAVVEWQTPET